MTNATKPIRCLSRPKFEYLVDSPKVDETTQKWLNRRGRNDWELVQVHASSAGTLTGFFKRAAFH